MNRMTYQKIINLLYKTTNQLSKHGNKNWIEITGDKNGVYAADKELTFQTLMSKSILCDCSDAFLFVTRTISVEKTTAANTDANNTNKKVIFKKFLPFDKCINEIKNTQVDNVLDIDLVMPLSNLLEYTATATSTSYYY